MHIPLTALLAVPLAAQATTYLPMSTEEEWRAAEGALRGKIESVRCVADPGTGRPVTQVVVFVQEGYRGKCPPRVEFVIPGGSVAGEGEDQGDYPALQPGEERVFFLVRAKDGKSLRLARGGISARRLERQPDGGLTLSEVLRTRQFLRLQAEDESPADLTPYAAAPAGGVNLAANGAGGTVDKGGLILDPVSALPARWVAPDRGEPIPYLVDATVLPVGVTITQALAAVSNALAAWTAVTGVTFQFEGLQDFGIGADLVNLSDEKIRIQLHDTHGSIPSAGAIAIGGRGWTSTDALLDLSGGGGGQVAGLEYHKAVRGFVVLRHSAPQFSNLKTLEEVIGHELGHVFGLAHSSQNAAEPAAVLRESLMYYRVHADNRGATLGAYDAPVVQKAHPPGNTPPWSYPRYMTAHTGAQPQTTPGVNEFALAGYDRQTATSLLLRVSGPSTGATNGSFSFSGAQVKFTPAGFWSNGGVGDPRTAWYAKVLYRYSDGVHCAPWQPVSVIAYRVDTLPNGTGVYGDGLPDSWMQQYWSNANPEAGLKRGPQDDYDGDGWTNLEEYRLATSPVSGQSRLDIAVLPGEILQWPARPWALYFVESSTDGSNWGFWKAAVPPWGFPGASITMASIPATRALDEDRRLLRVKQAP